MSAITILPAARAETPASISPGFFTAAAPARIILASFLLVTIPLAAALLFSTSQVILFIYVWLFGATHFVLTLVVYLQSENLRHFSANKKNTILFFVIPLLIFCTFYLVAVLRLNPRFPMFAIAFGATVRLVDFNHLNRQSFGVYQLFKARAGLRMSPAIKRTENLYFACLTGLMYTTYLAGGVSPFLSKAHLIGTPLAPIPLLQVAVIALGSAAAALLAINTRSLIRTWRETGAPGGFREALAYLLFQTLSAVFAMVSVPLYAATLAMHYVEYHVLMFPRCFLSRLDPTSALDRWYQRLRSNRIVFYGVVTLIAGAVTVFRGLSMGDSLQSPERYLALVAIFDGLFVFHYFVEAFIWRFQDPFFRQTVAPLYFAPRKAS